MRKTTRSVPRSESGKLVQKMQVFAWSRCGREEAKSRASVWDARYVQVVIIFFIVSYSKNEPVWITRNRTSTVSSGNADPKRLRDRLSAGNVARTESNAKTLTGSTTPDGKKIFCNKQNEDNND